MATMVATAAAASSAATMADGAAATHSAGQAGAQANQAGAAQAAEMRPQLPLPEGMSEQDRQNVSRVLRAGQTVLQQQQGGTMTLRLTPPEMGVVRIHMQVQDGTVRVQFNTDTPQARQLLQQHMDTLRQGLERQGLTVERLHAQTMPPSAGSGAGGSGGSGADRDGGHESEGRSRGQYGQQQGGGRDGSGRRQPPPRFGELLYEME